MMFVCKQSYRQFRGRVFAYGNPVEIDDQATIDAIQRDSDFVAFQPVVAAEPVKGGDRVVADVPQEMPVIALPAKRGWPKGKPRK